MWEFGLLPGGRIMIVAGSDGITLIDTFTGREVAQLMHWPSGTWLITLADGHWTGSDDAAQRLIGEDRERIDALRDSEHVRAFLASWLVRSKDDQREPGAVEQVRPRWPTQLIVPGGSSSGDDRSRGRAEAPAVVQPPGIDDF